MIDETPRPTLGERAADLVRNGMGNWRFVGGALVFLAVWIAGVTVYHWAIDNPQLTILNLGLSCLAALQGSILLIAARRQDQIAEALQRHRIEVETRMNESIERIEIVVKSTATLISHIEHDEHGIKAQLADLQRAVADLVQAPQKVS